MHIKAKYTLTPNGNGFGLSRLELTITGTGTLGEAAVLEDLAAHVGRLLDAWMTLLFSQTISNEV